MRAETEIRRRLVYLLQQKGYLMQNANKLGMGFNSKKLDEVVTEIKVLQWILKMED